MTATKTQKSRNRAALTRACVEFSERGYIVPIRVLRLVEIAHQSETVKDALATLYVEFLQMKPEAA